MKDESDGGIRLLCFILLPSSVHPSSGPAATGLVKQIGYTSAHGPGKRASLGCDRQQATGSRNARRRPSQSPDRRPAAEDELPAIRPRRPTPQLQDPPPSQRQTTARFPDARPGRRKNRRHPAPAARDYSRIMSDQPLQISLDDTTAEQQDRFHRFKLISWWDQQRLKD